MIIYANIPHNLKDVGVGIKHFTKHKKRLILRFFLFKLGERQHEEAAPRHSGGISQTVSHMRLIHIIGIL